MESIIPKINGHLRVQAFHLKSSLKALSKSIPDLSIIRTYPLLGTVLFRCYKDRMELYTGSFGGTSKQVIHECDVIVPFEVCITFQSLYEMLNTIDDRIVVDMIYDFPKVTVQMEHTDEPDRSNGVLFGSGKRNPVRNRARFLAFANTQDFVVLDPGASVALVDVRMNEYLTLTAEAKALKQHKPASMKNIVNQMSGDNVSLTHVDGVLHLFSVGEYSFVEAEFPYATAVNPDKDFCYRVEKDALKKVLAQMGDTNFTISETDKHLVFNGNEKEAVLAYEKSAIRTFDIQMIYEMVADWSGISDKIAKLDEVHFVTTGSLQYEDAQLADIDIRPADPDHFQPIHEWDLILHKEGIRDWVRVLKIVSPDTIVHLTYMNNHHGLLLEDEDIRFGCFVKMKHTPGYTRAMNYKEAVKRFQEYRSKREEIRALGEYYYRALYHQIFKDVPYQDIPHSIVSKIHLWHDLNENLIEWCQKSGWSYTDFQQDRLDIHQHHPDPFLMERYHSNYTIDDYAPLDQYADAGEAWNAGVWYPYIMRQDQLRLMEERRQMQRRVRVPVRWARKTVEEHFKDYPFEYEPYDADQITVVLPEEGWITYRGYDSEHGVSGNEVLVVNPEGKKIFKVEHLRHKSKMIFS